mmetsp:Transcript_36065/g.50293  ORF Transcript_36065/g.50293 Transcript_36065/m.50293 type:complete len:83 (+) Transcript_36065:504-752(+)
MTTGTALSTSNLQQIKFAYQLQNTGVFRISVSQQRLELVSDSSCGPDTYRCEDNMCKAAATGVSKDECDRVCAGPFAPLADV